MIVTGGSTDITTYFAMRLAATGADATGLTIADFDLQYVRTRTAPVAKVDAIALAATDTAHTDNRGIEIDATDQPGLYRFDWPDAAFAAGGKEVILSVKHTSCLTEHLRVEIDPFGAPAGASLAADIAAIEAQTDDIGAAGAGLTAVPWNAAWDAEVQSEVADALAVYDPPTNAEMEARTIVSANYATASALDTVDNFLDTEITAIKDKTDMLTFTVANQVDVNIQYVNDVAVTGTGAAGNEWGP